MGLDIYLEDEHVCHFSYSEFHRFRERLAAHFGWNLEPEHPLNQLLNHSDCNGELLPESAELGAYIMGIISMWGKDDSDRIAGERLALALYASFLTKVPLVFA